MRHAVLLIAGLQLALFVRAVPVRADDHITYEFNGKVGLRGLSSQRFRVVDYVRNRVLGEVTGPEANLAVSFRDSLLLLVEPVPPT